LRKRHRGQQEACRGLRGERAADRAAELGVPPAIIGKMVETAPSHVEWLTYADLTSMGVIVYNDVDTSVVARRSTSPAVPTSAPLGQRGPGR
jgi:hypothetical protein